MSSNSSADWCCKIPVIGPIVNNPIFTALLITAIVLIVIMAIYKIQDQGGQKMFKCAFYIFILITAITFIHHYAIMKTAKNNFATNEVKNIFSGIKQSKETPAYDNIPIINDKYNDDKSYHSHKYDNDDKSHYSHKSHHSHKSHKKSNSSSSSTISSFNSDSSDNSSIDTDSKYGGASQHTSNILKSIIDIETPTTGI
jgi:phosphomevalonate kinase